MHIRKIILALFLLGLSITATAQFTTVTEAYEVEVGDLRLPGSTGGTLAFKRCADCEFETLQVNSKTRYVVNNRDVLLTEFKKRVAGASNVIVTVMHHLESNTISMVNIRL